MADTICGYCGKASHMSAVWGNRAQVSYGEHSPGQVIQAAFTCDNCKRVVLCFVPSDTTHAVDAKVADAYIIAADNPTWHPRAGEQPDINDVPESISHAAGEAFAAASIGATMAAILMARTAIEATAKAKGISSGTLVKKIDELKSLNLIRPDIAEVAHEIRHFGNEMAHGDIDDRPTTQEAQDVLSLMMQVLAEVFQGPALLSRVKARRVTE